LPESILYDESRGGLRPKSYYEQRQAVGDTEDLGPGDVLMAPFQGVARLGVLAANNWGLAALNAARKASGGSPLVDAGKALGILPKHSMVDDARFGDESQVHVSNWTDLLYGDEATGISNKQGQRLDLDFSKGQNLLEKLIENRTGRDQLGDLARQGGVKGALWTLASGFAEAGMDPTVAVTAVSGLRKSAPGMKLLSQAAKMRKAGVAEVEIAKHITTEIARLEPVGRGLPSKTWQFSKDVFAGDVGHGLQGYFEPGYVFNRGAVNYFGKKAPKEIADAVSKRRNELRYGYDVFSDKKFETPKALNDHVRSRLADSFGHVEDADGGFRVGTKDGVLEVRFVDELPDGARLV